MKEITDVLAFVNRQMILIFKTNDLLRNIESSLGTSNSMISFLQMSRSCIRTIQVQFLKHIVFITLRFQRYFLGWDSISKKFFWPSWTLGTRTNAPLLFCLFLETLEIAHIMQIKSFSLSRQQIFNINKTSQRLIFCRRKIWREYQVNGRACASSWELNGTCLKYPCMNSTWRFTGPDLVPYSNSDSI